MGPHLPSWCVSNIIYMSLSVLFISLLFLFEIHFKSPSLPERTDDILTDRNDTSFRLTLFNETNVDLPLFIRKQAFP